MMQKAKNILFICTGNTCRSPMAEGIFNKIAKENNLDIQAYSAGINAVTGLQASKEAISVCDEIGVDLSNFTSTWLCDINPDEYDVFCVMTKAHKAVLLSLGIEEERIIILNENNGGVSDPYGKDIGEYRKTRDEIHQGILNLLKGKI